MNERDSDACMQVVQTKGDDGLGTKNCRKRGNLRALFILMTIHTINRQATTNRLTHSSLPLFNIHTALIRTITFRASLDSSNDFVLAENLSIFKCVNKHTNAYSFIKLYNNIIHIVFAIVRCMSTVCISISFSFSFPQFYELAFAIIRGTFTVFICEWIHDTKHMDKQNVQEQ